jgi:hypothetical protein
VASSPCAFVCFFSFFLFVTWTLHSVDNCRCIFVCYLIVCVSVHSVNIRDLVCLIYNTLRQSLESSPQSALILHHVVCQIVELFCDLEPFYHRDRLASSPLHAGELSPASRDCSWQVLDSLAVARFCFTMCMRFV